MFGGLFDDMEQDADDSVINCGPCETLDNVQLNGLHISKQSNDLTLTEKFTMEKPPEAKSRVKLCGLKNLGATCYLNSLLQSYLYTPEFRDALFQLKDEHLRNSGDLDKPQTKARVIPIQLQRLFARMLLGDINFTTTSDLVASFGWTDVENVQQQDVQELHNTLMSAVESSLVDTPGKNIISDTFRGKLVNKIICQECGNVSEREEEFLDVTISVANGSNLEDGLTASFVDCEAMDGSNQYLCNKCNRLVNAKKVARLRQLPPILGFSLLRFTYNLVENMRTKNIGRFTFPKSLDMAPFCDMSAEDGNTEYELYSVLIHRGSTHGGHYHAYIKDIDALGNHYLLDDDEPAEKTPKIKEIIVNLPPRLPSPPPPAVIKLPDELNKNDPLDVITYILACQPDQTLTYAELEKVIAETTGTDWSPSFGQRLVIPLSKFLQCECLRIHHGNKITLKKGKQANRINAIRRSYTRNEVEAGVLSVPEDMAGTSVTCIPEVLVINEHTPTEKPKWFDFNDTKIVPIKESCMEKLFSGRESAYMLFYRRKSLKRPSEAHGNPSYGIPDTLARIIAEENVKLQRDREKYYSAVNKITVHVHMDAHYQVVEGSLSRIPETSSPLSIHIDKRSTLSTLYEAIQAVFAVDSLIENYVLTIAKEFSTVLHLYKNISRDHTQIVNKAGIKDGNHIFIWNGQKVGESPVLLRGEKDEPLSIKVIHENEDGSKVHLSLYFSRTYTLNYVATVIARNLKISPEMLHFMHGSQFSNDDRGMTLSDLGFSDEYVINTIIRNSLSSNGNQVCLTIKNHCQNLIDDEHPVVMIEADLTMTVKELRNRVVKEFGMESGNMYRLAISQEDEALHLPLYEECTIAESNLRKFTCIILELGKAPQKDEMSLRFFLSYENILNCNVNKSITAQNCLDHVIKSARLEDSQWCLRLRMWNGDAGKSIPNSYSKLVTFGIQHGSSLIVEQRQCSPTKQAVLTIWFYLTFQQADLSQFEFCSPNKKLGAAFKRLMAGCPTQNTKLGELTVPFTTTLNELKIAILTLPLLKDIPTPSLEQMRIRTLVEGVPSRLLRGSDKTLNPNAIMLSVMLQRPYDRAYYPPTDVILDWGDYMSIDAFKETIAEHLTLSADTIIVAKKVVEKHEWIAIENKLKFSLHRSSKPKPAKVANKGKGCLLVGDFLLRDGDIIRVKDLLNSISDKYDFNTEEEHSNLLKKSEGRQPIRSQTDYDVKERNEPSSEQGIKIHVGDFNFI